MKNLSTALLRFIGFFAMGFGMIATVPSLAQQACPTNMVQVQPATDYDLTLNSGATVLHNKTGLTWQRCSIGQTWSSTTCTGIATTHTWSQALNAAKNNTGAGGGWRLPNISELASIVEIGCSNPSVNVSVFPATVSSTYLTGSTISGSTTAMWVIDFTAGIFGGRGKDVINRVRLVRGGQPPGDFDAHAPLAVAPGAPTAVAAIAGNAQATVTFAAPASDGGAAISGYTATSTPSSITGNCTAPCTSITVSGLTNGTPYTFTVTATNSAGAGVASAASSPAVTPATVPAAPTIATATAGNAQAIVSFVASASNGGAAITGYTAICGTVSVNGAASPIVISGLTNGIAVNCTVGANNSVGASTASATLSVTPVAPAAGAITGGSGITAVAAPVTVTIGEVSVTFVAGITATGVTSVAPITAASRGTVPSGFTAIAAVDITSTASVAAGNIDTCFIVGTVTDAAIFASLRVYHLETGAWIDRTLANNHDFAAKRVCARTTSLSPFAVMQPVAATPVVSSDSSFGCSTGANSTAPDPTLPLLLALAWIYALRRRMG